MIKGKSETGIVNVFTYDKYIRLLKERVGDFKMSKQANILLVCSAGMSTSLLMTNMEKAAKEKGIDVKIQAMSSSAANKYIAKEDVDVLLLGPQVRFLKKKYEKKLAGTHTKLAVIDMQDYGQVNGEKVLESALQLTSEIDK